jgi:hypothetical protein
MEGILLLYRPFEPKPEIIEFTAEPEFSELRALVGGDLEPVPGFFSIEHEGAVRRCVAFCDADGKRKGLPLNMTATILWHYALRREMGIGLIRRDGKRADDLVGPVSILFGTHGAEPD